MNVRLVKLLGFEGGISYKDNESVQYIGYGDSCNPRLKYMPCYINPDDIGCYSSCGREVYTQSNVYFLNSHPNLKWIETDVEQMINIRNTIKLPTRNSFPFMYGRTLYDGKYRFGMIVAVGGTYEFQFLTQEGVLSKTSGFEILTCS